jgi:DDE superfamily endonuclease
VFLKQVARAWPRRPLHVGVDNASAHTHAEVTAWLARHPRITLHFTPTSVSWMNQVRTFLGLLTRQAVRRGSFASVPDLVAAIGRYIQAWNADCHPLVWVKDADQILVKAASRSRPSRGPRRSSLPAAEQATFLAGLALEMRRWRGPGRSCGPGRGVPGVFR